MRHWSISVFLGLASVGVGACSDDDESPPLLAEFAPDPAFDEEPRSEEEFAGWFAYTPVAGCAVSNPRDLAVRTELRVFRGTGVSEGDAVEFLSGLQRYYDQYGVQMFARHAMIEVPVTQAMVFDPVVIAAIVRAETGVDINRTDPDDLPPDQVAQVQDALARAVVHNMREFMSAYAMPRRNVINVVMLAEMVGTDLDPALAELAGLLGLGISPELLASFPPDDPGAQLYDLMGVDQEFTPTAFVGVRPTHRFGVPPDLVISHEIGHAYGLLHVTVQGNLLNQGEVSCSLALDDTQLATVSEATSRLAHSVDLEAYSLTTRAADFLAATRDWSRWAR